MTIDALDSAVVGERLGKVAEFDPQGGFIGNAVELFVAEMPDEAVAASDGLHAYIGILKRDPRRPADRVAIGFERSEDGEAIVGISALDTDGEVEVMPNMVEDVLDIACEREGVKEVKLAGTRHIKAAGEMLSRVGFKADKSGKLSTFVPKGTHKIQRTSNLGAW